MTSTLLSSSLPYPGLRSFERHETDIFFGREAHTDEALARLGRTRFLAVTGPSGCGKSSLVKAGLVPALEAGLMTPAGSRWRMAEMRPGTHALQRLAKALLTETALGAESSGGREDEAVLLAALRRGPLGLLEPLRAAQLPARTNLLIVVDQFEELFRYTAQADKDEAKAFVALLLESAAQQELAIYVILTMRSDFLGDCARFSGLPERLNDSQYLTPRLDREQRRAAILNPARVFGGNIDDALVNRLLNDAGDEADQLPLLQHVLMRMWAMAGIEERLAAGGLPATGPTLTVDDYEAVGGGLAEALSRHADEAYLELDAEGRRVAEVMFRALSERGADQREVRRPATAGTIAALAHVDHARLLHVVDTFRREDRNFLWPRAGERIAPGTLLDISHESLIRQWARMSEWVEAESRSAETYRLLEQTARLWDRGESALWGTPNLENALAWKESERPTPEWAERYGGKLDLALRFLEASQADRARRLAETDARREQELQHVKELALAVEQRADAERARADAEKARAEAKIRANTRLRLISVVAVLAALLAAYQWNTSRKALREAERHRGIAELARQDAQNANLAYQAATAAALADKSKAEQQTNEAQAERARAEAERARAQGAGALAAKRAAEAETERKRAFDANVQKDQALVVAKEALDDATQQRENAEKTAALARSNAIAAAAMVNLDVDPELSVLLAQYAGTMTPTFETENVLRRALGAMRIKRTIRPRSSAVMSSVAFSPVDGRVALGLTDGQIQLWDSSGDRPTASVAMPLSTAYAAAFNPDGTLLVVGDLTGAISVWETASRQRLRVFDAHENSVNAVQFSPDGRVLVTASSDGKASVWEMPAGRKRTILSGHTDSLKGLAFTADGQRVATGSDDGTVRLWDLAKGIALETYRLGSGNKVRAVAFGRADREIYATTENGTIFRIDSETRGVQPLVEDLGTLRSLSLDASRSRLAVAGYNGVRVFDLNPLRKVFAVDEMTGPIYFSVSFSPDGTRLAAADGDGAIRLWDTLEGAPRVLQAAPSRVWDVRFNRRGDQLVGADQDGTATVWNVDTGRPVFNVHTQPTSVHGLRFSPDGRRLAAYGDNAVSIWTLGTGGGPSSAAAVGRLEPHDVNWGQWLRGVVFAGGSEEATVVHSAGVLPFSARMNTRRDDQANVVGGIEKVAFSDDGEYAVLRTLSPSGVDVWAMRPARRVVTLPEPLVAPLREGEAITAVAVNRAGNRVALGFTSGLLRLIDVERRAVMPTDLRHTNAIRAIRFTADGRRFVSAGVDNSARMWSAETGAELLTFRGHSGWIEALDVNPAGTEAVTVSRDGSARTWNLAPTEELKTLSAHIGAIRRISVSRDQRLVAVGGAEGARIYEAGTWKELAHISRHTGLWDVEFSPDGTQVATGGEDGSVRVFDLKTGTERMSPLRHEQTVRSLAFNSAGTLLASGGDDSTARVWDLVSGLAVRSPYQVGGAVDSIAFSPDGTHVVTGDDTGLVTAWNLDSDVKKILAEHSTGARVNSIVFSADGGRLLTASDDQTAKLWDVGTGELLRTFSGHTGTVKAAIFSPDGSRVVTASFDTTSKVWDVATGQTLVELVGHRASVRDVRYGANNDFIATVSEDGTMRIYVTRAAQLLELARERVTRSLTQAECRRYLQQDTCPAPPAAMISSGQVR